MKAKGKKTFWITNSVTGVHQERALLLRQNGFDVQFFSNVKDLIRNANESRPICIIIDPQKDTPYGATHLVQTLASEPELNGVRFIACLMDNSTDLVKIAIAENFRDAIPLTLPPDIWLHRMQYATSAKPIKFQTPLCEIGMNQVAIVLSPARIVWVKETHMRIECRGNYKVGSSIHISGSFASALGLPHISLIVESVHKEQLMYRYSQALICRWRVPGSHVETAAEAVRKLNAQHNNIKARAFIAISRPNIRSALIRGLNPQDFEVKAGLQRSTLAAEIGYYSPDAVFMDDRVLESLGELEKKDLVSRIRADAPIIIYGKGPAEQPSQNNYEALDQNQISPKGLSEEEVKSVFTGRSIYFETAVHHEQLANAVARYRIIPRPLTGDTDPQVCHVASEHPWSKIEVHVPARLTSLNPSVGQISLPHSIGAFTLAKLEAPILRKAFGRDPCIKITEVISTDSDSPFSIQGHFYLADVDWNEKNKLGRALVAMQNDYYKSQFGMTWQMLNATAASGEALSDDISQLKIKDVLISAVAGSLALKETATQPNEDGASNQFQNKQSPSQDRETSRDLHRNVVLKSVTKPRTGFKLKTSIDLTIVKAIVFFALASALTVYILQAAAKFGENNDNSLGREYTEFFMRMNRRSLHKNSSQPSQAEPSNP